MRARSSRERVPPHLRRFVVEQDMTAYNGVDQAVWRFVLLQMYARLKDTAHPAYVDGLARTGMSVDSIPSIAAMDACLAELGWGAVCVDGFIPPRAFQEFQALGILPIAAEIRTVEHLAYTPAPDIIHEAAGHAPILPDPEYAAFLRRIGEFGSCAFASPRDVAMYDAIYELSVVKERWDAAPDEVARAERRLAELAAQSAEPSEAALLSRLYWWTVEYGLWGTPADYRLYGAGLLSSLGESHFCHEPRVRKLPLTRDCVQVDYDITRPQPQLFVVREFAQLNAVLDEVCASFAFRRGGDRALEVARAAAEVATVELDSGMHVTGRIAELERVGEHVAAVRFEGPTAVGEAGALLPGRARLEGAWVPLGPLAGGALSWQLTDDALRRLGSPADGRRTRLQFASGLAVEGVVEGKHRTAHGALGVLELADVAITLGSRALPVAVDRRLALVAGCSATSVRAGSVDSSYWPEGGFPDTRVPALRRPDAARSHLLSLYEQAERSFRNGQDVRETFAAVHRSLVHEHPDEWLLRWNLLESSQRLGLEPRLRESLVAELVRLERHYGGRHPIASGLRFLGHEVEPVSAPTDSLRP